MRSLLNYGKNYYSQAGEDGILEEIFKRLEIEKDFYVDVGAHDGMYMSNTHILRLDGWRGLCIECDENKLKKLRKVLNRYKESFLCTTKVEEDNLDEILFEYCIPKDFGFLDIDIDSYDYYVWKNLKDYSPKVVQVEILERIPLGVKQIHGKDNYLTSFSSMLELGIEKGYTLASYTGLNMIFIRNDLNYIIPEDERNNPEELIYFNGKKLRDYRKWVNEISGLNS